MHNIEICYWWREDSPLPPNGRLYIGHEGCRRMLPDVLLQQAMHLLSLGRRFSLVIPFLTPAIEADFPTFLRQLPPETEVVANDAGAFLLAVEAGFTPALGRLLSRQHTDPAIATFQTSTASRVVQTQNGPALLAHTPPPESLWTQWQTPPVFSAGTLEVFRRFVPGVPLRVEIDCPPHGLPEKGPMTPVTLHCGEAILSATPCHAADCVACSPALRQAGYTRTGTQVLRRRNLYGYRTEQPEALPAYVDRIVLG